MKRLLFLFVILLLTGCIQNDLQAEIKELSKAKQSIQVKEFGTSKNPIIRDKQYGMEPRLISIPSINMKAKIAQVGLLPNGQMDVPSSFKEVGWFAPGPPPGDRGNAVMAGHVDSKSGPAIFYQLHKVKLGDKVIISDLQGQELTFRVVKKEIYPEDQAPVDQVFGYTSRRMLNLITCIGSFNRKKGTHEERLVVYTELEP